MFEMSGHLRETSILWNWGHHPPTGGRDPSFPCLDVGQPGRPNEGCVVEAWESDAGTNRPWDVVGYAWGKCLMVRASLSLTMVFLGRNKCVPWLTIMMTMMTMTMTMMMMMMIFRKGSSSNHCFSKASCLTSRVFLLSNIWQWLLEKEPKKNIGKRWTLESFYLYPQAKT